MLIWDKQENQRSIKFGLTANSGRFCFGLFSVGMKLNVNEKQKQITSIGGPALHSALQLQFATNYVQDYS